MQIVTVAPTITLHFLFINLKLGQLYIFHLNRFCNTGFPSYLSTKGDTAHHRIIYMAL